MADVLSVGVNLEAFSQAINAIQALRSSVSRVFDCLKDGMRNKETLEGREKAFIAQFQDNLHSVNRDLNELERLSNLVGKPSENHPLHNSGLLSLDPVQDKTPLYSQLLQAYKWSNKVTLGKVLKVIVVMRSLFIDRTIVKGFSENVYTEDGKLDIWSKSNYQVFQKVTDHATTALLHYQPLS
ncbi:mediator complex subunit 27 [Phyllostomus discolor]|uniref:Mediator of RNA polymerase II transcription subunit 27 n=1 Tax=Phyllostomus discolor TaxID=89673 RepID=A0A834BD49_9CHIR|nr:mediator complex subunit 27 [Phyllostomus discolor]